MTTHYPAGTCIALTAKWILSHPIVAQKKPLNSSFVSTQETHRNTMICVKVLKQPIVQVFLMAHFIDHIWSGSRLYTSKVRPGSVVTSCDLGNLSPTFPDASNSAKHHPPPAAQQLQPWHKNTDTITIHHTFDQHYTLDKCVHASVHAKRRRSRRFLDGLD